MSLVLQAIDSVTDEKGTRNIRNVAVCKSVVPEKRKKNFSDTLIRYSKRAHKYSWVLFSSSDKTCLSEKKVHVDRFLPQLTTVEKGSPVIFNA